MTMGLRIKAARLHRGLTQQELGLQIGLSESTAAVRIAQYESSARRPKEDLKVRFSEVLNMNSRYFYLPDEFAVEDIVLLLLELDEGLQIEIVPLYSKSRTRACIHFDCAAIDNFLIDWVKQKRAFASGVITKQEYTDWALALPKLITKG